MFLGKKRKIGYLTIIARQQTSTIFWHIGLQVTYSEGCLRLLMLPTADERKCFCDHP